MFDAFLDIRHPDVKAGLRGHPDLDSTDKVNLYTCLSVSVDPLKKGSIFGQTVVSHLVERSSISQSKNQNITLMCLL